VLVLSRKNQESILIGGNITIRVVRIAGDKVRLGIEAPQSVQVWRGELAASVAKEGSRRPRRSGCADRL